MGLTNRVDRSIYGSVAVLLLIYVAILLYVVGPLTEKGQALWILLLSGFANTLALSLLNKTKGNASAAIDAGERNARDEGGLEGEERKEVKAETVQTVEPNQARPVITMVMVLLACFMPLVLSAYLDKALARYTFNRIGLRVEGATLLVDDKNFKMIESSANQLGIPVLHCDIEGTDRMMVYNMDVLWHGVGERSLVAFPPPELSGDLVGSTLELERDGVHVLLPTEADKKQMKACLTLNADALFDTYSPDPNPAGQLQLEHMEKELKAYLESRALKVVGASIVGFADSQRVVKPGDDNVQLSERRAKSVQSALGALLAGLSPSDIEVVGLGSAKRKAICDKELHGARLTECMADDRRVEVRLRLERAAPSGAKGDVKPAH
jgi:outer membrane protein OmpA-like peptidoglycan-associated protein